MPVEVSSRRPHAGRAPDGFCLDLSAPDFTPLAQKDYAVAYICAAVTSLQACQAEPGLTRQINVVNTIELMPVVQSFAAFQIHRRPAG